MFFVSARTRSNRITTCKACKYYKQSTLSCGTLGIGKTVQYKGKKHKLCGCVMPVKTRLKVSSCPLGKWHAEISAEQVAEIKKLINGIGHTIPMDVNRKLTQIWNKTTGENKKVSSCSSCVRQMVEDMQKLVKDYEDNTK